MNNRIEYSTVYILNNELELANMRIENSWDLKIQIDMLNNDIELVNIRNEYSRIYILNNE